MTLLATLKRNEAYYKNRIKQLRAEHQINSKHYGSHKNLGKLARRK